MKLSDRYLLRKGKRSQGISLRSSKIKQDYSSNETKRNKRELYASSRASFPPPPYHVSVSDDVKIFNSPSHIWESPQSKKELHSHRRIKNRLSRYLWLLGRGDNSRKTALLEKIAVVSNPEGQYHRANILKSYSENHFLDAEAKLIEIAQKLVVVEFLGGAA